MKEAVIRITEGAKEGTIKVNIEFVGGQLDMDALPHLAAIEMVNKALKEADEIEVREKEITVKEAIH